MNEITTKFEELKLERGCNEYDCLCKATYRLEDNKEMELEELEDSAKWLSSSSRYHPPQLPQGEHFPYWRTCSAKIKMPPSPIQFKQL